MARWFRSGRKTLLGAFTLVVVFALSALLARSGRGYFSKVPICLNGSDLPYVEALVDGKRCPLMLDLGCYLEAEIQGGTLGPMVKYPVGEKSVVNFRGTAFDQPAYVLPCLKVGELEFPQVIVVEGSAGREEDDLIWPGKEGKKEVCVGLLGRGLLKKRNLLLDVEQRRLIFANDTHKLKKEGYDLSRFVSCPFEMAPEGVVLEVETDLGKKRMLLDTGCTWSLLRNHHYPKEREVEVGFHGYPILESQRWKIEGVDFGPQELIFLDVDDAFGTIDGFLGMDFLKKHIFYIDFAKKLVYLRPA